VTFFAEMAVLLLMAAVVGAIGVRLRQPLIVAFKSWKVKRSTPFNSTFFIRRRQAV